MAARAATDLPALRKDFTVGPADVCDARLMGADAVLLIVAALFPTPLQELAALARHLGLDALVEVHDEAEVEVALAAGATLIGVNQRDLVTFEVDTGRAARVAGSIPDGVVRVAESGIRDADDARRLADAGYHAIWWARPWCAPPTRWRPWLRCGGPRCSSRSAAPPARRTPCSRSPWAPTPSASSSPPRPARSPRAWSRTSSSGCRPRSSPSACSATSRPSGWSTSAPSPGLKAAQLHGREQPEQARWVRERMRWVIQAFAAGDAGRHPGGRVRRRRRPARQSRPRARARCSTGRWPGRPRAAPG